MVYSLHLLIFALLYLVAALRVAALSIAAAIKTTNSKNIVVLLNWEGCIADTVDWRIQSGLDAATQAWPQLPDKLDTYENDDWIRRKMAALSHIFNDGLGNSLSCDYALLARLIVEEQELDQGRSVGKTGKYASLYHPQQQQQQQQNTQVSTSAGTRPLTTGEIASNWGAGAMLRETLLAKYHCERQNPLPILQGIVDRNVVEHNTLQNIMVNKQVCDKILALRNAGVPVILCVGHSSDLIAAERSLSGRLDVQVCSLKNAIESITAHSNKDPSSIVRNRTAGSSIPLIVKPRDNDSYVELLQSLPSDSTLLVFCSCLESLKERIPLFGNYIPRGNDGVARTIVDRQQLSLGLCQWAATAHPSRRSQAIMNPWLRLATLDDVHSLLNEATGAFG
jgi:hypothetical protein